MREIKFRGKRIDNNQWVYGHYFISPLTDENSGTTPDVGWFFLTGEKRHCISSDGVVYVVIPETIGQFIGKFGKNGKEIYEGDITNWCDNYPSIVRFNSEGNTECCGFELEEKGNEDGVRWHTFQAYTNPIIVLGNIFDNPELLEVENES